MQFFITHWCNYVYSNSFTFCSCNVKLVHTFFISIWKCNPVLHNLKCECLQGRVYRLITMVNGLRHEMSLPAQTLRSWVWNTLKPWMFGFILCSHVAPLQLADPSSKESCWLKWNEAFPRCPVLQLGATGINR
jgi:hypothetical protein